MVKKNEYDTPFFKCFEEDDIKLETYRALLVLLILGASIYAIVYVSVRIEAAFIVEFSDDTSIQLNYNGTLYSISDINENIVAKSIEFGFTNIEQEFNEEDLINIFIKRNSTSEFKEMIIDKGFYYIRSYSISNEDQLQSVFKFKTPLNYTLFFIRLSFIIENNENILNCYKFYNSNDVETTETAKYHVVIHSITNTNTEYPTIGLSLKKDLLGVLSIFDISFR